jgi:hypothetical protein
LWLLTDRWLLTGTDSSSKTRKPTETGSTHGRLSRRYSRTRHSRLTALHGLKHLQDSVHLCLELIESLLGISPVAALGSFRVRGRFRGRGAVRTAGHGRWLRRVAALTARCLRLALFQQFEQ